MSFSFNPDGSLKAAPRTKRDHLCVLLTMEEVPFGMGRRLLTDHLRGRENAKTVKLRLERYSTFGDLGGHEDEEIRRLLTYLEAQGYLTIRKEQGRYPVYTLTPKGEEELREPKLELDLNNLQEREAQQQELENPFKEKTNITEQERALFEAIGDFFPAFNDEQRKAVTSPAKKILCVAGAGSGKTSVLTKRIAFLTSYKSVPPERILAITFTRKARKEMQERLAKLLPQAHVKVETFNSHCEKELQRKGGLIYDKEVRMMSFKEHYALLLELLKRQGMSPAAMVERYFTKRQRQGKDDKTLFFSFAYDFNALLDKLRLSEDTPRKLRERIKSNQQHAPLALLLLDLAEDYAQALEERGLRDYTDQIIDTIKLYEKHPEAIPRYEHVLVDEYQDVNDQQIRLLELLAPENLFVVGDPRQSIYGWRGSRMSHIIGFPEKHPQAEIIQLTKNYRSARRIVELCNKTIRSTGYADLEATTGDEGDVGLHYHASEDAQAQAVTKSVKEHPGARKEIFVLARTNKALEKYRQHFDAHGIKYLLRTDELKRTGVDPTQDQVTLATVHAIKGLEAQHVHLISASSTNFPCKASDHPVMDLFGLQEDYDSYAEELRVLYVALSRAKKTLQVHYTGSLTPFLPQEATKDYRKQRQTTLAKRRSTDDNALMMRLRQWRYRQSQAQGCPAYVICPDKTLEALIDQQPSTIDDLYGIPGMGAARIEQYGEDLLLTLAGR